MPVRVEALIQLLRGSPLVRRIRVVDYDETPAGSLVRSGHLAVGFVSWYHVHAAP